MWRHTLLLCSAALVLALVTPAPRADGADPPVTGVGVGKEGTTQPALGLTDVPRLTDKTPPGSATGPASQPFDANDPDVKLLVKGLNEFAIDLYKEIAKTEEGNIFFSPFSISSALAMTYAGARGKTAEEMAKVLHLPPELLKDDAKRLHAAFAKLNAYLNAKRESDGKPRGYNLAVANRLWGQEGLSFLEPFIEVNKTFYGAGFEVVDFKAPEPARKTINDWVEKHTQGMVKGLISKEAFGEHTIEFRTSNVRKTPIYGA